VSLSKTDLLELMAYRDGEIDDNKVPEVEALVARSEPAKRILEQGDALRPWAARTREATAAGSRGIANAVMARIEELEGAAVPGLGPGRAKVGLGLRRILHAPKSGAFGIGFGTLAAVAAAVGLFYLWPLGGASDQKAPLAARATRDRENGSFSASPAPVAPSSATTSTPIAVAAAAPPEEPGIDIDAIESPEHQFSIFYVPGATAHASSVVVWIGEE
jgi:hypothetical protein